MPLLPGGQHMASADDVGDVLHAAADAAWIVILLEPGEKVRPDDSSGEAVRHDALEAIADFDAHLPLGGGNEDEHAVVVPLLPDAPLLEEPVGVLLHRHPVERRHRHHRNLRRRLLFDVAEQRAEFRARLRVQHVGAVVDVAPGLGERRREIPEGEQQEAESNCVSRVFTVSPDRCSRLSQTCHVGRAMQMFCARCRDAQKFAQMVQHNSRIK